MPRPRVAVGSIFQESNHFVATRTGLDLFQNSYVLEGRDLESLAGTDCEVAGILAECARAGAEVVPLLAARSVPGGQLDAECYAVLKAALLTPLRLAAPVDGVILAMHGSMAVVGEDDPEGDILIAVRDIVGPAVPVVMTLDLHAHVTPHMVTHATALVSFTHYPHDDTFSTGERGTRLLLDAVHGRVRPSMAVAKVPLLAPGCNGQTFGDAPMAHLTRMAREWETQPGVLSVSCFQVHPHLDVPGMGCAGLVVTDGDPAQAATLARRLAEDFWARRASFLPEILAVDAAVGRGQALPGGPVLLVDAADCAGGGAPGDSVALLRALLALGVTDPTYVMAVCPQSAAACAQAGIGGTVTVELGYHLDPTWGEPLTLTGTVGLLCDGRFRYTGGLFGGTWASMGLSAVLQAGSIRILVMSRPTYDWADEQYRAAGMDVRQARFVGVKNPMNYKLAYRDVAQGAFIVDTPGPTSADVQHLPYRRMPRPFFPLDEDVPDMGLSVMAH
jgi:microcystin degradation protein MlrC